MDPSRTFQVLVGTGAALALLLGVSVCRVILAGCPDGWDEGGLTCFFLPTPTDLGIHLLSYAFIGTIILGASSGLVLWQRQWIKTHALPRNLALLRALDNDLDALTSRLSLEDKVDLLDCEVPLCFCAGFISPRIYLSRRTMEKLTPRELEALLLHEKHHLENHAPLKILVGKLVVSALSFIPILRDMLKRYLIETEIAADQSAINYQGHPRGIAGALEKMVQEHTTTPPQGLAIGGADALAYRIDHLMGHAPQHVHRIPLNRLVTSSLIVAFIVATAVAPLPGSHPI